MTSSNGNISALLALCVGKSPANFPHKGQWCRALMFSLIRTWIHDWVLKNREAGDLSEMPSRSLWCHCNGSRQNMDEWLHLAVYVDVIVHTFKINCWFSTFLLDDICTRWIPTQRPVTRSFDVFFDLRLNKRLSKQSWSWWFETLSRPLLRHCNENFCFYNHSDRCHTGMTNVFKQHRV